MRVLFMHLFLIAAAASFGLLAAAGVFTVFVTVGIVPRFAGRTHTADKILLYEEMVIMGAVSGSFFSIFPQYSRFGFWLHDLAAGWNGFYARIADCAGISLQVLFGFFCGIFVGCLALAIAEMLDSIPIFARRISFRHGVGYAILAMAAGKMSGSLFYFMNPTLRP